jgi:peptidoglycan/LPS O-acetylase OafA/YrhL
MVISANQSERVDALTSMRFFAAFAVVIYHWRGHFSLPPLLERVVSTFNVAVDLFFILSGFILTLVYHSQVRTGRFSYRQFLLNRFARIYPLHLVTFAAYLVLLGLLAAAGMEPKDENRYTLSHIPLHLTMTHAWGFVTETSWNDPSWSISAEWFAYLVFGAVAAASIRWVRSPVVGVIFSVGLFVICAAGVDIYTPWTITEKGPPIGIIRIMPEFLLGHFLYLWVRGRVWNVRAVATFSGPTAFGLTALIIGGYGFGLLSESASVPLWGVVIAALYLKGTYATPGWMEHRAAVYLGEISYAVYMIHMLFYTVWFNAWEKVIGRAVNGVEVLVPMILVVVLSAASYHLVEVPGRRLLRELFIAKPQPAMANP